MKKSVSHHKGPSKGSRNGLFSYSTLIYISVISAVIVTIVLFTTQKSTSGTTSNAPTAPNAYIASISTYDTVDDQWVLDANTTITSTQTLDLPGNIKFRIPENLTLTNLGTITINNNSTLFMYNSSGAANGGTLINSGSITVAGTYSQIVLYNISGAGSGGILRNQTGGTITLNANTKIINQNADNGLGCGDSGGIIINAGSISNSGIIENNNICATPASTNSGGYIYTYGGGTTDTANGSIINGKTVVNAIGGTISTSTSSGNCGVGTFLGSGNVINGTSSVAEGVINSECPP